MFQLTSIFFIALFILMPGLMDASAEKAPLALQVLKAEVEDFVPRVIQALKEFDEQSSEANCAALETLNDELYRKVCLCKDLSTEERSTYEEEHQNALRSIHYARSARSKRAIVQKWCEGNVGIEITTHDEKNDFRTLAQDLTLAQKIYPYPQQKPYAALWNDHGWTEPLAAFAKKDNLPLFKTIVERVKQHAERNYSMKLAQGNLRFTGTLRCFALRTPFEKDHRRLMQNITTIAPYTSLHYLHAPEHAPLVIASVVVEKEAYEQFAQANPLVNHPDVHVFADVHAMAFLEYVHDVATDNNRLKTKRITSNLGQFYKEHDEHQTALKHNLGNAVAQTLPVKSLQMLVATYLADQHPEPAPQTPLGPLGAQASALK